MKHVKARGGAPAAVETVSEKVVQAVADQEEVSPLDITPPLFDAIDPDALDRLYGDGRPGVTIDFQFSGYRVTVGENGCIDLTPLSA